MANLNKVMLIGRLTRDPEIRVFANGGKVANFGFAVNKAKKNVSTGQWEEEPVFIDIKAFNKERGKQLADLAEQYMKKGQQFYFEGHLQLDQWTSQDGQKQSKLRVVLDNFEFLEPRGEGGAPRGSMSGRSESAGEDSYDSPEPTIAPVQEKTEQEIPF